ncbi:MAG: hypothetical protein PVI59_06350 [Anaerolineae bacterium]|jgi:hypothetical protein
MIELHLSGHLRGYAPESRSGRESVIRVTPYPGETVGTVLARAGIESAQIHHVFLNGVLLSTPNPMAPWLDCRGSEQAGRGLDTPVEHGDRLGLFGHDMPLLVI